MDGEGIQPTDGSVTLCGMRFDNPVCELYRSRWDYREFREGARTSVQETWLERYVDDGGCVGIDRHCLQMTNRGSCSLDGSPMRDKADIATAKAIFAFLKENK